MRENALLMVPFVLLAASVNVHAFNVLQGKPGISLGYNFASQGKSQHINMQDMIGNDYLLTKGTDNNFLVGVNYFINAKATKLYHFSYGINAFYLAKNSVRGIVVQESMFSNLSWQYNISHVPIYAVAKAVINNNTPYAVILDAGIGPNIITTQGYQEYPLDDITLPDNAFSGRTETKFSATAGIGFRMQLADSFTSELGYRFFYLGDSHLNSKTSQILDTFKTGCSYANAVVFTITA